MEKYRIQVFSEMRERDGMGIELFAGDDRIAEVFHDDATGERTVTIFDGILIPLADFDWFLAQARERL